MTVGSSPTQQLQLTSGGVDRQHAILTAGLFGRLYLRSLSPGGVQLNGRRVHKSPLRSGDILQFGSAQVTLRESRSERLWVLVVDEQSETDSAVAEQHEAATGALPVLKLASWSVTLTLGIAVLFLLLPMGGVYLPELRTALRSVRFLPSDSTWSPGSLHASHRSIGARCEACHAKPFEPVRNQECLTCHADVRRHVDLQVSHVGRLDRERCTNCHLEHSKPSALVQRDQRICNDCHGDLDTLKPGTAVTNVTDFATDHPDFRVTALAAAQDASAAWNWRTQRLGRDNPAGFIEQSHLRFSHRKHLDPAGIKSPQGDRVLACQDCHRPDTSGRYMRPIQMETHCASCHSLKFDEHDPSSTVPHGNLQAVFSKIQEHFSSEFLAQQPGSGGATGPHPQRPGQAGHAMSAEEAKRAREWVDTQTLKVARELLEKRVCADCHEVRHDSNGTGLEQWHVVPVRLTAQWMPHAQFDHARHVTQKCTSCHKTAPESDASSDILMPRIAECRECHGGAAAENKVSSDCVMCHAFHVPNRERWASAKGPSARTSP